MALCLRVSRMCNVCVCDFTHIDIHVSSRYWGPNRYQPATIIIRPLRHIHIDMHVCMNVCMYVYMYVCMYMCM